MKLEYTTIESRGTTPLTDRLKGLGEDGWDLVTIQGDVAYLKRPVANGRPAGIAKACGNCSSFDARLEKDADGLPIGVCREWKLAMTATGSCEKFVVKAFQNSGEPIVQPATNVMLAASPAPTVVGDVEDPRHWQPRSEAGEKKVQATSSQEAGLHAPSHKHRITVIMNRDQRVVRGKTDFVNGHAHAVSVMGLTDEADGHTHVFEPLQG